MSTGFQFSRSFGLRDGPVEKLLGGGGGIFEPQEYFFVTKIPCMNFFLGHSMNTFASIVLVLRPPPPPNPQKFSNGPSLTTYIEGRYHLLLIKFILQNDKPIYVK